MEINFDIEIGLGNWHRSVGWRLGSVYRNDAGTYLLQAHSRS